MKAVRKLFFLVACACASVAAVLAADVWKTRPAIGADTQASPRSEDEQRTIRVYKESSEAVVFITTITLTVDPFDFFSTVQPREGSGSGVLVDVEGRAGVILTNLHVIQDADKVQITLADGKNYSARLLGHDPEYDIAVLELQRPPPGLANLRLGDSAGLEVGQRVLAIGNPFGLDRTLTSGIISSLNRTVRGNGGRLMRGLIQTDAAINPGNSGGALLDTGGRLIGVNTAILSQSGDSAGIGFAVPINQIRRVLPELIATGKVLRPRAGWVLEDTNQGPMVRRVMKGGPADEAGLRPFEREVERGFVRGFIRDFQGSDLILKVNGKRVMTKDEVEEVLSQTAAGGKLKLTVRRGGMDGPERDVTIEPVLE